MTSEKVSTYSPEQNKITMSDEAIAHLKKQIAKRGSGIGMRLGVKKSGCSGYGYAVELINEQNADDKIYQIAEGLIIAISLKHLPYLQGTTIDYVKQGMSASFKFTNPNEVNSCGCGSSFSIEE